MSTFPTPFYALLFLFLFLLLLLTPLAHADCECGYTVNSALYTDLLETDFLHLPNITLDTDWQPQNYTVSPAAARGPYGKNATIGNVIANPLQNNNSWAGEGVLGGDPGLQLWARGGTPANGLIPMAEVASAREDMLYGSFRAAMKLTGTSGTCGAFFWVHLPHLPISFHLSPLANHDIRTSVLQQYSRNRLRIPLSPIYLLKQHLPRKPRPAIPRFRLRRLQRRRHPHLHPLPPLFRPRHRLP